MTLISFPAKILLFGEYTILQGSEGLAMPLPDYHGVWEKRATSEAVKRDLAKLATYIEQNNDLRHLDMGQFREDLEAGWSFNSNIPVGYGVGSSGALTAALYQKYARDKQTELTALKKELGQIEGFFHGSSSGLDPLVSYLNQPIQMKTKTELAVLSAVPDFNTSFYLIDTGIRRSTEKWVHLFFKKLKDQAFKNHLEVELVPAVNDAIHAFLNNRSASLFGHMHQISMLQFEFFREMIPEKFQSTWKAGLAGDAYKLKLCGAGGGGFIIGMRGG